VAEPTGTPDPPKPYGAPINLLDAKQAAAAVIREASRHGWKMAVAVVDPAGVLVYYEKMDDTQTGSANVAIDKARSAALFKRSTMEFQRGLTASPSGLNIFRVQGAVPVGGGVPLVLDGRIVGAVGVSGDSSENDHACAELAAGILE
jgi:glc operon protein GlcG